MSIAGAKPQDEPRGPEKLDPCAPTTPRLPVVQICHTESLEVYYSANKAVDAAQAAPNDDFFDMRGACLALSAAADGSLRLEAGGEGAPDALKQRLLDELRREIESAAPDAAVVAAAEEVIRWAAEAPDVEHMVHALWFAECDYGNQDKPCRTCSAAPIAKHGIPPCCPGAA